MSIKITKHGRQRFIERVGYMTDEEIRTFIIFPNSNFNFVIRGGRLITVIPERSNNGQQAEVVPHTMLGKGEDNMKLND